MKPSFVINSQLNSWKPNFFSAQFSENACRVFKKMKPGSDDFPIENIFANWIQPKNSRIMAVFQKVFLANMLRIKLCLE